MRALLDEYGHTIIALIIVSVMLIGLLVGTIIPQLGTHAEAVTPKDTPENEWNAEAIRGSFLRPVPAIEINTPLQIEEGSTLDFDDYIINKTIRATNADGVDVSNNIVITSADVQAQTFFNTAENVFGGPGVAPGEYSFILSVVDCTDAEYFGGTAQRRFTVVVTEGIS